MRRLSTTLAAGFAAALLVVAPAANAAVSAKDAPSKNDISAAFPALAGGTFTTDKAKSIGVPSKSCGAPSQQKANAVATTGVSANGQPIVIAGVAELGSVAKAKAYFASYKTYVKNCSTYTEPTTGATVNMKLASAPRLGQGSLGVTMDTSVMGITSYSRSVLIRDGKRIATVSATDAAAVSATSINKLAKVAAKKMK